jgi:Protein of unknown function (DUF550)
MTTNKGQFERTAALWMEWSEKTFVKATAFASTEKAQAELEELQEALVYATDPKFKLYEIVDVMMCLLHTAKKAGFTMQDITQALAEKAKINYKRKWVLNDDGRTYSHKK